MQHCTPPLYNALPCPFARNCLQLCSGSLRRAGIDTSPPQRFVDDCCASPDCVPVLVAHNGRRFDFPLLLRHCAAHGVALPANWHYYDTLHFAQALELAVS